MIYNLYFIMRKEVNIEYDTHFEKLQKIMQKAPS